MSAQITLVGRLTADPELRFTSTGTAVARFTVATSRRRRDGDQWVDADTTFWVCTAWEQLAEHVAEHLTKGAAVIVVGQAHQTSWESEDGQKRSRVEVRAEAVGPNLRWPPKPAQRIKHQPQAQPQAAPAPAPAAEDPWANGGVQDEPPF